MTSYLSYLFSSPVTSNNTNTCSLRSEYIRDVDKYYDSIRLNIHDSNTSFTLGMDVLKTSSRNALSFLTYYCDKLESNESITLECDGDSNFFFRPPFNILQEKDNIFITLESTRYNRSGPTFSTKVKKEDLLVEFKKMIQILKE